MSLSLPESIRLLLPDGSVRMLLLEDYLRGVVAAGLSADAPLEAMKALSVAARTFAGNTHRHLERSADVCTLRHCQVWNERANPRVARAVLETRGMVATYNDTLIEAFYFEHCDGKTRDAQGVLVNAPAYLKSVSCRCGFAAMKGHGIGMCLRGMLAMAHSGDGYNLILRHFYTNIVLERVLIEPGTTTGELPPEAKTLTATSASAHIVPIKPIVREDVTLPKPTTKAKTVTETPAALQSVTEKPSRKTIAPRRTSRKKVEETPPADQPTPVPGSAGGDQPTSRPSDEPTTQPTTQPSSRAEPGEHDKAPTHLITSEDSRAAEADDLLLFLAIEDFSPTNDERSRGIEGTTKEVARPASKPSQTEVDTYFLGQFSGLESPSAPSVGAASPSTPSFIPPNSVWEHPTSFQSPPPSMPEEMPDALDLEMFAAPPTSMPEELPSASVLDFLAPPVASVIEPDLAEFVPPIEKFYAPLDAPPTMPEAMPTFSTRGADETPFAWVPPPPLEESGYTVKQSQVLIDALPGPRIIAGNLRRAGMLVTIRDARGNGIVTVSGVAKQYGAGGFEAPLTDDGAYHVKFDGTELDVKLENETVFIYYG